MNIERIKKVKRSKPFTAIDGIIVCILVVGIAVACWLIYGKTPSYVRISADGYEKTFRLDVDTEIALEHLTVHIEGGSVWVTDADCADKVCERTGKISRAGQSIVCLPHGVVITVVGDDDGLSWEIGQ